MQRVLLSFLILGCTFCVVNAQASTYRLIERAEIERIIQTVETNICNPSWLESPEWQTFTDILRSDDFTQLPLDAFKRQFNEQTEALPFTHLYLKLKNGNAPKSSDAATQPAFELAALNDQIALLTIRAFVADGPGMLKLVQQIQAEGYQNLIIDLQENTGGTLDAPVMLGRFLTNAPIDAGVYLTRQWFEQHDRYPSKEEIDQFPFLKDMTYPGIMKAYAEWPAFRMVLPGHSDPIFTGQVAVLTSSLTASACEPLVDLLQKRGIATLVGRKTAGAMLSGADFPISEALNLFLPISDYLTADGTRIDKVGVEPDVDIPSEQALQYVLDHLFVDK